MDTIEEDIIDQRERLMKIDSKMQNTMDTLKQTEQALGKLSKLIGQDSCLKVFILLIAAVILLIFGMIIYMKT